MQDEFDIQMSETMQSEVPIMCNLSKGVMMKTLGLSLEQAMIALEVPDADRPKYQSLVEEQ